MSLGKQQKQLGNNFKHRSETLTKSEKAKLDLIVDCNGLKLLNN